MAKNRYEEMINLMTSKGWSKQEIDSYVANFNEIYGELCRSITTKASSLGRSGLEVNDVYLKSLGQLRNELAAVASTKISEDKPVVFFTDTDKGPQGDLLVALKNTTYLKNFLTDPKKKAVNNGYPGVKIPLANKAKNARQYEDEFAVGPKQLFCTLDRDGVKNIDGYIQYLTQQAFASEKTRAAASYGLHMFDDLSNAACLERAMQDQMAEGGRLPISEYTIAYEGQQKYARARFLEDAIEALENGDVYYFGFVNGEPALDLGETIKGTMFDTKLYKSATPLSVYVPSIEVPGKKVLNFSESAFVNENPKTGTCAVGLTRENLTLSGFGPIDESTKMLLGEHYTGVGLARIEHRHQKIAAQRGLRPVVKKPAQQTQAPTVKKPTQKSIEAVAKKDTKRTHIFMPSGVVPAFKPIKAQSRSKDDMEGFLADSSKAKSNYALSQLQKTVQSDVDMLGAFYMSEISTYILHYLSEEVPGITRAKIDIYKNLTAQKIYEVVKQKIEETGKAELKFGKNGPVGDLKVALDSAYAEYAEVFKGVPQVDFSDMKGFNMGESQEEYDSLSAPTGDMTISADGKIVVKENNNTPSKKQDDGQVK